MMKRSIFRKTGALLSALAVCPSGLLLHAEEATSEGSGAAVSETAAAIPITENTGLWIGIIGFALLLALFFVLRSTGRQIVSFTQKVAEEEDEEEDQ